MAIMICDKFGIELGRIDYQNGNSLAICSFSNGNGLKLKTDGTDWKTIREIGKFNYLYDEDNNKYFLGAVYKGIADNVILYAKEYAVQTGFQLLRIFKATTRFIPDWQLDGENLHELECIDSIIVESKEKYCISQTGTIYGYDVDNVSSIVYDSGVETCGYISVGDDAYYSCSKLISVNSSKSTSEGVKLVDKDILSNLNLNLILFEGRIVYPNYEKLGKVIESVKIISKDGSFLDCQVSGYAQRVEEVNKVYYGVDKPFGTIKLSKYELLENECKYIKGEWFVADANLGINVPTETYYTDIVRKDAMSLNTTQAKFLKDIKSSATHISNITFTGV